MPCVLQKLLNSVLNSSQNLAVGLLAHFSDCCTLK